MVVQLNDILQQRMAPEAEAVRRLLATPVYTPAQASAIGARAAGWVENIRHAEDERSVLDSFLAEYGLSNAEGVALMCLAEAYLRIPDSASSEDLILEKLTNQDWERHLGHAASWLVNSSTWALMLTGKVLKIGEDDGPRDWLEQIVDKLGLPLVQAAVRTAMQILGGEFVLGETIEAAVKQRVKAPRQHYSFDMLGEGARSMVWAQRYQQAYSHAIDWVGRTAPGDSVSIKLSALHPRYEPLQRARVLAELQASLKTLCLQAMQRGVDVSIDAEEMLRLPLSLELFDRVRRDPQLQGWSGLGLVVQAYAKCAPGVIAWVTRLARESGARIPVRLVKGAYWDAEIKAAQIQGWPQFPVYTRKATTDVAYLHCAAQLMGAADLLYPQFATHNAHTLAAVTTLATDTDRFECQRLHGMGEQLYAIARQDLPDLRVRVYAPVGGYAQLLAYLVRRLLENGANSSFVNRLHDDAVPVAQLIEDPYARVAAFTQIENPLIRLPDALYADRRNSVGIDLSDGQAVAAARAGPWTGPANLLEVLPGLDLRNAAEQVSPADHSVTVSWVAAVAAEDVPRFMQQAAAAAVTWAQTPLARRCEVLLGCADALQAHQQALTTLLCHEAGKTLADSISEVREAVDFCRYYAVRMQAMEEVELPGPTGERNRLRLRPRGVFVCISPWNFPLAIFTGQVAAALVAGNSVVAKPAEPTPLIAAKVLQLLTAAGLPQHVCQVLPGGAELGSALVAHPLCSGVAFTGSTGVARQINQILAQREGAIVPLIAETGGQNAMVVDSTALLEQVSDDVMSSAFNSAGQRCSALRILCLQEDIADDALALIHGAMQELQVGHPFEPRTDIGPIISAAAMSRIETHIQRARDAGLTVFQPTLDTTRQGNYLPPTCIEIERISWLREECFGPVLHVLRFKLDDLHTLVQQINATGYGLTFGLHSRLTARAAELAEQINAGNVYINRNITGAVVGSQPFGGQGLSGTGPKAGGPHYLPRFCVEQTLTDNTTAIGGNLTLLSQ